MSDLRIKFINIIQILIKYSFQINKEKMSEDTSFNFGAGPAKLPREVRNFFLILFFSLYNDVASGSNTEYILKYSVATNTNYKIFVNVVELWTILKSP